MAGRPERGNSHLPSINTSPRKNTEDYSTNLQASPGKQNNSNLSQINSSSNEDENLMRSKRNIERDATLTIQSPSPLIAQKQQLMKHDSDLNQDSGTPQGGGFRAWLADLMESRITTMIMLWLIMIYLGLTLVNVLLDHYTYVLNENVLTGLKDLKYLEIAVLSIFMLELLGKLLSSEHYFVHFHEIFDAALTMLVFALVVVAIVGDQTTDPLNTHVGARGALRLFRVLFLTRKMNHFSGLTRNKVNPSGPGLKSNMEKILELLNHVKIHLKDENFGNDIDWASEVITNQQLYDPVNDQANIKKMEKSGAGQWFRSFGNNYGKNEKRRGSKVNARENGRRLSLLASGLNSKESVRASSTSIPKNIQDKLETEIDSFFFDPFLFKKEVQGNELVYSITYLFQRQNMFELLNIDPVVFTNLMTRIQNGYFDNPYHNYLHALDVLQTTNYFITTGQYIQIADLSNVEIAAMYIAATIHDFEHPGTNNIFQMNTGSVYALRYNDKAVLENHHVAACFELMKDANLNIFANLSKSDYKTIRERVVAMVLATDMSQHFSDIGKLKGRLATDFNIKDKDKNFTMEVIVHAADISNPTKSWETCKEWTFRITQEFFNQGDKERELKLPITALCDKYTTNIAKSQIGFIDFVVSPLFVLIKEILPQIDISHLDRNKANWKDLVEYYDGELVKLNETKAKEEEKANEKGKILP